MCLKSTLINHIEELEHAIVLVLSSNYPYTLGSISMNLINRPTPWENTLYHIFRCMMTACSVNVGDRWPKLIEIQTWCGWYDSISNSSVVPGRPKFYPSGLIIPPRHTPAHPKDGGRAPRTQQGLWRWICSPWKNQYLRCDYVNPDVDMSEDDTSTNLHLFTSRSQGLS